MANREFDVVVIGAGPAGEVVAGRLADGGLDVVIVERELIGGECSFYACMPSKALLRPAELLAEASRVPGASEALSRELDPAVVLARRDEVIHGLDDASMEPWLSDRGIELVRGEARIDGERRVVVGDETLMARKAVVVATGTTALLPPIEGLDGASPWTNRQATTHRAVPESLIVVGGGPVGCELAQAWRSLGSVVTVVEVAERLLAREEPFAGEQVAAAFERSGISLYVGVTVESVAREGAEVRLDLEDGPSLTAEQMLVAAGRRPNTKDVGLDSVGIDARGFLEVDDQLRVGSHDWLYAIGDVNGRSLLTHAGKYQARVAADVILGKDATAVYDDARTPRVTFTDPEVAAVGYTLAAAKEHGIDARAVEATTSANAGASFIGRNTEGTSQLVIDDERGVIVGATFVGYSTAELLHAATVAVVGEVPLATLDHAMPAFPTRNEVWLTLLEKAAG